MQRRVTDLKAAGLNPGLAYSQGGASAPTISGQTTQLQNPDAAFGQMGAQASSAIGAQQQQTAVTANANASNAQAVNSLSQAAKNNIDAMNAAGVDVDVKRQGIAESQSKQQLMTLQGDAASAGAQLDRAQIQVAQAQLPKIQAEIQAIGASKSLAEAQTHLANVNQMTGQLNNAQFKLMSPELYVQARIASQKAEIDLSNLAVASRPAQGAAGTALSYADRILNMFHIGANISKSN